MPRGRPKKNTDEATTNKTMSASQLINHLNKKFGANTAVCAADLLNTEKSYISTGNAALDILLGGGLLEGKIHQFRGNFSSTKTTQALKCALEFLKKYEQACFIFVDIEDTSSVEYLVMLGYEQDHLERTFLVQPGSGEETADVAIEAARLGEKVMVLIDSVDAMTPTSELSEDMAKAGVSPGARMINKFMRKLVPVMRASLRALTPRCTVIMICQLREKIGVMFGDNSTTWGGKGKDFSASTIIKFSRIAWLRDGGKGGLTYGMRLQAEAIKCKGFAHGESVEYSYYKANFDGHPACSYDNVEALFLWGVRLKVIAKSANTYTFKKASGTEGRFCEKLLKLPKTTALLTKQVIAARKKLFT